ncbi:hypothetical protein F5Y11DRAFT_357238 [Daldinia sp. FL1419]|nr:hypothetical protein F5Y11DRAFT_357238 [Daldinia sp. FL1419]
MAGLNVRKSSESRNKPACDRCRGQKLCCIWDSDLLKCHRCARADTICVVTPRRAKGASVQCNDTTESICDRGPVPSTTGLLPDVLDWSFPLASSTGAGSNGFAPPPTATATHKQSNGGDVDHVKQSSDVQVAIIQHPLHDDSVTSQTQVALSARVADIQLGRLFALTAQLRGVTERVVSLAAEQIPRQVLTDNAMALLVLSRYSRLDYVYARAMDVLREVQGSDEKFDNSYQLISVFSIDGFSLGACQEFQIRLNIIIEGLRGDVEYPNKVLI